ARLASISDGITAAQNRLATLTHDPFEPPPLRVQAPGKAEARTEVLIVSIVAVIPFHVLDKLRIAAQPGDAEQISPGGRRVAVVERGEGQLQLPPQAVVDGQIRPRPPGVLGEKAKLTLAATLNSLSEIDVLAGLLVQLGVGGDGRDAPGQHRIKISGAGPVGVGRAWEIARAKKAVRRIVGVP